MLQAIEMVFFDKHDDRTNNMAISIDLERGQRYHEIVDFLQSRAHHNDWELLSAWYKFLDSGMSKQIMMRHSDYPYGSLSVAAFSDAGGAVFLKLRYLSDYVTNHSHYSNLHRISLRNSKELPFAREFAKLGSRTSIDELMDDTRCERRRMEMIEKGDVKPGEFALQVMAAIRSHNKQHEFFTAGNLPRSRLPLERKLQFQHHRRLKTLHSRHRKRSAPHTILRARHGQVLSLHPHPAL